VKKKVLKKHPEPRYITIKIKYYPVEKETIFGIFLVFFFFLGHMLIPFANQLRIEAQNSFYVVSLPKFYSPPALKAIFAIEKSHIAKREQVIRGDTIINNGPRDSKRVALTFDADMTSWMRTMLASGEVESYYDKPLVDLLVESKTEATFFLTGMWIESYPDVAKELGANSLFELGDHSYSHRSFDGECYGLGEFPDSEDYDEVAKTEELLRNVAGVRNRLFRFPGGCYGQKDISIMHEKGLFSIQWDVEGRDGFNDDASSIINNVLSRTTNGSIIVLHMNGYPNEPKTLDALQEIIPTLKKKGFEFVKVSELLGLDEEPREVVFQSALDTNVRL
jgi:peptidoglycan/xylan/chitin deacetylase (PgdA/CDA1 family)